MKLLPKFFDYKFSKTLIEKGLKFSIDFVAYEFDLVKTLQIRISNDLIDRHQIVDEQDVFIDEAENSILSLENQNHLIPSNENIEKQLFSAENLMGNIY